MPSNERPSTHEDLISGLLTAAKLVEHCSQFGMPIKKVIVAGREPQIIYPGDPS